MILHIVFNDKIIREFKPFYYRKLKLVSFHVMITCSSKQHYGDVLTVLIYNGCSKALSRRWVAIIYFTANYIWLQLWLHSVYNMKYIYLNRSVISLFLWRLRIKTKFKLDKSPLTRHHLRRYKLYMTSGNQ